MSTVTVSRRFIFKHFEHLRECGKSRNTQLLACLIHIFEDNKGLLCYKHVVKTMFAATKEASECLKIAQHSVCCSQEFFASLSWPNLISERGVPMAELCC